MIKFSVPIKPVAFKRTLVIGKRHFNDPSYSDFKSSLGYHARSAMRDVPPLTGAVKIAVDVYHNRKPTSLNFGDADNHLKAVCDALNGICYIDDRQIVYATVRLHRGDPHIDIQLEEL